MWHYQLSAGPRSKWDCPALLKSQMMRGVLRGLKEAASRIPSPVCLCGPMPWTRSSGSSKRRMPVPNMSEKMQRRGAGNLSETRRCNVKHALTSILRLLGLFHNLVESSFTVVLEHVFFMIQKEFQQILFGGIPTSRNLT